MTSHTPLSPLPIDALLPDIVDSLKRHPNLVLVAPPGAGKTTRVPLRLSKEKLVDGQIVMLQPRRIAARASAERLAAEAGWRMGEEVGYQVRFENRSGPQTRLRVVTEGILTRQLQADPTLEGVGLVILDEFHERSLHTDLAIALLRELQQGLREDLRIVVMSATLEAAPVARFLGDCPVLESQGRAYPVDVSYRPRKSVWSDLRDLDRDVFDAVDTLVRDPKDDDGHVLVFLPGAGEIRRCESQLAVMPGFKVMPLHGSLPFEEQDRALRPLPAGSGAHRKLILATNIAETSLTIDGVSAVVDTGIARTLRCDPKFGLERLELSRISAASATQRAGRAGRQRPGRAIRLWSKHEDLRPSETPEVQRVDLASAVLTLADWGVDAFRFGWFSPPSKAQLESSRELLQRLGALDARGAITSLGRRMLILPTHPRFARICVAARAAGSEADLRACASAAAVLGERDLFSRSARADQADESDVELRIEALEKAERLRFDRSLREDGIDANAARQAANARDQLLRQAQRLPVDKLGAPITPESLSEWLLLGFPDRVTRRRAPGDMRGVMVGGRGVQLEPSSSVREAGLYLSLDPQEVRQEGMLAARVGIAAAIDEDALSRLIPGSVAERTSAVFNEERGTVSATCVRSYWDLPLGDPAPVRVEPDEASRLLAEWLARDPRAFFESDERAALWLRRVSFLKKWMPESPLPEIDDAWLSEVLEDLCAGAQNLAQARARDALGALEGRLAYRDKKLLDDEAPLSIEVPSGSRIRIDYGAQGEATLAVRLQEIFGWMETPRLAAGRAPVLMELLSPGFKPVQITNDLASFWARGYAEVRKELRARYPKHSWPEDPYAAQAVAKGRHRNTR